MEGSLAGQDFTLEIALAWGLSFAITGALLFHAWRNHAAAMRSAGKDKK